MTEKQLTGTAKTIFDEAMDEINEEFKETFSDFLSEAKLTKMIDQIQIAVTPDLTKEINELYQKGMSEVDKMILGEKIARIITKDAKIKMHVLLSDMAKKALDLVEILRNEVIGEVFEETESSD